MLYKHKQSLLKLLNFDHNEVLVSSFTVNVFETGNRFGK